MHNDSDHHNESLRSVTFSRGARPRHPRAVWSTPAPPGSRGYFFGTFGKQGPYRGRIPEGC